VRGQLNQKTAVPRGSSSNAIQELGLAIQRLDLPLSRFLDR